MEIICPVLLMFILVYARTAISIEAAEKFDVYQLKVPLYPTAHLLENNTWTTQNFQTTKQAADMLSFLEFANYSAALSAPGLGILYHPLLDPIGPNFLNPPNCYPRKNRYGSPLVAYINQDNQIQADVIEQLDLLFKKQKWLKRYLRQLEIALEFPNQPKSIATFMVLLDGGSDLEQIQLLASLGVPQPLVTLMQLLRASNQTEPITPESTYELLNQAYSTTNNQSLLAQKTLAQQTNTTVNLLNSLRVLDIALALGFDRNQTQLLLDDFTKALVSTPIEQLAFSLNQTQQSQFQDKVTQINETQNGEVTKEQQQALQQLIGGNQTLKQFEEQNNSTLQVFAAQVGLTPVQANFIAQVVGLREPIELFEQVSQAQGNLTQLGQISKRFGITQAQIDLLALAAATEQPITLEVTQKLLGLDTKSQLLLLAVLSNQAQDDVDALVEQTSLAFSLDQKQKQAVAEIVQSGLDAPLLAASDKQSTAYRFFEVLSTGKPVPVEILDPLLSAQLTVLLSQIAPGVNPVKSLLALQPTDIQEIAEALNVEPSTVELFIALTGQLERLDAAEFGINQTDSQAEYEMTLQNDKSFLKYNETWLDRLVQQGSFLSFGNYKLRAFSSHEELDSYISHPNYGDSDRPGICWGFQVHEHADNDYELELMFNDLWPVRTRSLPSQQVPAADPTVQAPLVQEYGYYVQYGFAHMQNFVANTLLKRKTIRTAQIVNMVTPSKVPVVYVDGFNLILQAALTLFILLSYIPIMYRTVYRIVFEKVTKAKESMRIMGMQDLPYWLSWFCYYTIVNTVLATSAWGTLMINVFKMDSGLLLWAIIWLYGQSLFGLIMITQSVFQTPRAAAITCTVVYFGITILGSVIDPPETAFWTKFWTCLFFPQIAMIQSVQVYTRFVTSNIPMNFQTFDQQVEQFSVKVGLFCIVVGGIAMFLLGLYLENVMPKTFGARKHLCFCLIKNKKLKVKSQNQNENGFDTKYLKSECFEPAPHEIQQKELIGEVLKISDLKKQYENGFQAVDGMNIKMYADQIFVLLGHNGAGKTTTISMLTGLLQPTEGQAKVFGIDMFNKMDEVRQLIGVCPQYDVLFELLTVEEHLSFFYDIKGADPTYSVKQAQITQLMKDCGVYDKRNALAYQLSGGNKRKLSVAIALCGGSKFILLDEPTSGMDLQSRRQLWNMLKEYKKDRIVILTTHYMDEADILGDRIGIMTKGKMTCLGSSIFLKSKFGLGYTMTIIKATTEPNAQLMPFLLQRLGSGVKLQSEIQAAMTIQIPQSYSTKFAEFFSEFDRSLEQFCIKSYGISISTLEEVFLKIGHLDDPSSLQSDEVTSKISHNQLQIITEQPDTKVEKQRDFNLKDNQKELNDGFFNCLMAVLYKRIMNYRRNKKAIFNEVIIPAIIVLVGFGINKLKPPFRSESRIQGPDRLPQPQQLLFNSQSVKGDLNLQQLVENLPQPEGSQFIVNEFSGDQKTMHAFGDAMFELGSARDRPPYMYGSYQVYEADLETQQYKVMTYVNMTSQDAAGLYPQFIYESILKVATGDPDFKFKVRSTPYPPTFLFRYYVDGFSSGLIVFITGIAYSVMITTVVSYLVTERIQGLKHLQEISGLQLKAYWTGNFLVDFIKMQLTIGVTLLLFHLFEMGIESAWLTYLLFPFGALPFTYITSFMFSADSAAQTFTMFFHFLTISILSTVAFALRIAPAQELVGDYLNQAMKAVPTYPMSASVFCDLTCYFLADVRDMSIKRNQGTGGPLAKNEWDITNLLGDVIAPFVHLVVWATLLILIEKNYFRWLIVSPNKRISSEATELDDDVRQEAERVLKDEDLHQIQISKLKKVYRVQSKKCCKAESLIAVSDLSFSLQQGECFALLGVNGAGKSTTFKSLTCEIKPTSGRIKIAGYDVLKQFEKARKLIGYCPQPNLIFDSMTVEEHINYYAWIKGIPVKYRRQEVDKAIKQLGLDEQRMKPAGTLSGGNQRKVCVAQALVGSPQIILLDEPSAGMDPEARRFMWSVVAKIAQNKTSAVVLTTHSMDEAEALSTKMGIMVKGGIFRCFGSAQHIRNKFGTGYVIELKIRSVQDNDLWELVKHHYNIEHKLQLHLSTNFDSQIITKIVNRCEGKALIQQRREVHYQTSLLACILELCQTFQTCEMIEHYGNYMRLRVKRLDRSIGSVFGMVESFKGRYCVESYSVSQTTLEQIFQGFADTEYNEKSLKFEIKKVQSSEDTEGQSIEKLTIVE